MVNFRASKPRVKGAQKSLGPPGSAPAKNAECQLLKTISYSLILTSVTVCVPKIPLNMLVVLASYWFYTELAKEHIK